jgi:hypothetical protein
MKEYGNEKFYSIKTRESSNKLKLVKCRIDSYANKNEEESEMASYFENLMRQSNVIENYSGYQKTAFNLRGTIIEWLYLINNKLNGSHQTLFKAILLLDEYLMKETTELDVNQIQLIAAVCYYISSKLEEVNSINLNFLQNEILKGKFNSRTILDTEIRVLKKLNFKLQNTTIQKCAEVLIEIIKHILKDENRNICNRCIIDLDKNFIKMNLFVNLMSLLVSELMFNTEPYKVALINLFTTQLFLEEYRLLNENQSNSIDNEIEYFMIDILKKPIHECKELFGELKMMSHSLFGAIQSQINTTKRKIFFDLHNDCIKTVLHNIEC